MKNITIIFIVIASSLSLKGQEWFKHVYVQKDLIEMIKSGKDWNEILEYARNDLKIEEIYLEDIKSSIEFLKEGKIDNSIDSLFLLICLSHFDQFPFRQSGHLTKDLYSEFEINFDSALYEQIYEATVLDYRAPVIESMKWSSINPFISSLYTNYRRSAVPLLLKYLENNSASRLIVPSYDNKQISHYLSFSDLAMEIIELITYCDFYDNASHNHKLFSNLDKQESEKIISDISNWHNRTLHFTTSESINYFLDSICEIGHSYTYTCHNLMFIGDSTLAKLHYQKIYELINFSFEVGKILHQLGDRRLIDDCINKIINYRYYSTIGQTYAKILLQLEDASFCDGILAEVVLTEPHSRSRKLHSRSDYTWHTIFNELAIYEKGPMPITLIALMKRKDSFKSLKSYYKSNWEEKYKDQIQPDYRICDLALLKFHETVEEIESVDWDDINSRDVAIEKLIQKYELK